MKLDYDENTDTIIMDLADQIMYLKYGTAGITISPVLYQYLEQEHTPSLKVQNCTIVGTHHGFRAKCKQTWDVLKIIWSGGSKQPWRFSN